MLIVYTRHVKMRARFFPGSTSPPYYCTSFAAFPSNTATNIDMKLLVLPCACSKDAFGRGFDGRLCRRIAGTRRKSKLGIQHHERLVQQKVRWVAVCAVFSER